MKDTRHLKLIKQYKKVYPGHDIMHPPDNYYYVCKVFLLYYYWKPVPYVSSKILLSRTRMSTA